MIVASFKEPSKIELAHDFLWRAHLPAPAKGQVVIYNRSHYEDVLVVRVIPRTCSSSAHGPCFSHAFAHTDCAFRRGSLRGAPLA